jgi:FkbM family methyltransferase
MLPPYPCILAQNEFGCYCVPPSSSHRPAVKKILDGEVYEPQTLEFMRHHAGGGDVIHAGTYFGDFLPALSRSIAHDRTVWAFEPNSESHLCASWTVRINNLRNIVLSHSGLSDETRPANLQIANRQGVKLGGASRVVLAGEASLDSNEKELLEKTHLTTIDATVPHDRPVSILQLDVEGHEISALHGGLATIRRSRPIIIVEALNGVEAPMRILEPLGYKVQAQFECNAVFSPGR